MKHYGTGLPQRQDALTLCTLRIFRIVYLCDSAIASRNLIILSEKENKWVELI